MYQMSEYCKLIISGLTIAVLSSVINIYLRKDEKSAGLVVKFHNFVDEGWIKDLHEYIQENIKTWDNKTFTKTLGHCTAYCNDNNKTDALYFDLGCATHPVLIFDSFDTDSPHENVSYAEATLPCFLKLRPSRIPKANRGIFTTHKIPKGFVFGPYTGVIRSAYGTEGDEARDGGYAWRINIYDEDDADFYIDGVNDTNSNWLRYVNTARYEEEQNMFPTLFNNTVYYVAYKDVEPETELLVWYGYKYAKWLRIFVIPNSTHDWDTDFAPVVADTICPSCPRTKGERRKENDDTEEEEEEEEERTEQEH